MRILFDVSPLFRGGRVESGVPTYTLSLIEIFNKLPYEVIYFYSGMKGFGLEKYISEYVYLPIPNKLIQLLTFFGVNFDWLINKFADTRRLAWLNPSRLGRAEVDRDDLNAARRGYGFDVYFTPNISTFYRYFSDKIKVVGVVHDISQILFPELKPLRERWKYFGQFKTHLFERLAFWNRNRKPVIDRFHHLVAISGPTKRDLVEFLKIPEDKITVIYPTFRSQSTINSQQSTEELRRKYNIVSPYLLFLGHIEPRKNVENLLRAFQLLKAQTNATVHANLRELQLVIAGRTGYQFKRLVRLAREVGLTYHNCLENVPRSQMSNQVQNLKSQIANALRVTGYTLPDVIFTGPVSEDEKYILMQHAEVFVYPSLYEGFAYPCLEAMLVGTPVVTSPVSALPEILGDAALYADPWRPERIANIVGEVLNDQHLRNEMVEKGKKRVEMYQDSVATIQGWKELFEKI